MLASLGVICSIMTGVVSMTLVTSHASAQSTAWEAVGPAPPAVVAPVAVGPAGSGVIYIATFGGGVLKSTDDGRSFRQANTGLGDLAVNAMASHPTDPDQVYVATLGDGMFHTRDGGTSWAPLPSIPSPTFSLTVDPVRPSIIYSGHLAGPRLRKSIDSGATWADANIGLGVAPVWSIKVDRQNPDVVYAGTGGAGAFKSMNAGASWSPLSVASNVFAIAIDPQDSRILYVGTDGSGVFRSFDGGNTFAQAGSPPNTRVLSLALDPSRQGVVYAGTLGGGVAVSFDYAETFTETTLMRGLALSLASSETGEVYVGTSLAGVLKSGSYGAVWSPVAAEPLNDIKAQNIYGVTVDPSSPGRVLVATNQAGMFDTVNGGRTWQEASVGLTSRSPRRPVFDPSDSNRVYAGSLAGGGLFLSNDRGRTWASRFFGPPNVYVYAVAVGPDRTVYAATKGAGLWRSRDLGATFVRVSTPFTDLQGVGVDPNDARRILSGGSQGLYRSVDGGTTWTQVFTTFTDNIVFDPRNSSVVYVTTQTTGVQRSTDGGVTFSAANTGLTNLRVSRAAGVVIDPRDSQLLYVATEGDGVFKSRNGGATWSAINNGLTNRNVFALAIDPLDPRILYVGGASGVFKTTTGGEVP